MMVQEALDPNNQTAYDLPGASCGTKELARLMSPHLWLNDEIINFWGVMINLHSLSSGHHPKGDTPKLLDVHCFSSFLFSQFELGGHEVVKRWTKKVDLFQKHLVLFPINLENMHWVLGVINNRQKRFEYYDSLGGRNPDALRKLRRYYQDEHRAKKQANLALTDWTDYQPMVPLQSNSSDCGVFVCQFMHSLSRDSTTQTHDLAQNETDTIFDFTAENMPYFRQRMIYEIITKEFISDQSNSNEFCGQCDESDESSSIAE